MATPGVDQAVRSAGSKIKVRISGVFTLIPGVQGATGPGAEAPEIEWTPLDPDTPRDYVRDVPDPGTFNFRVAYMPGNAVHQYLLAAWKAGTEERFKVEYKAPAGAYTEFSAFVKNFPRGFEKGQVVGGDASLKVTGDIVDA
jgi:hypothetical protein